jgi:hypothetical protein
MTFAPVLAAPRLALLALGLGLAVSSVPAAAQPTAAQQEAIKSSCRSDYMANCMSVKPGGIEALQCLERNMAKLSGACKGAVSAATAKSEPARAEPAPVQQAAPPAPPTAPVVAAPSAAPVAPPATVAAPAKPATAKAAAPAAAPAQPTQAQTNAIRQACPSDFRSKCPGVTPGGEAALACLKKNEATLSAACRNAVSAIGGVAPAAATAGASPASAPAAAPAPATMPVPTLPPLMEARLLRTFCAIDFKTLCKGVQLGQGRALQCLASNAGALSPGCRQAMAAGTR